MRSHFAALTSGPTKCFRGKSKIVRRNQAVRDSPAESPAKADLQSAVVAPAFRHSTAYRFPRDDYSSKWESFAACGSLTLKTGVQWELSIGGPSCAGLLPSRRQLPGQRSCPARSRQEMTLRRKHRIPPGHELPAGSAASAADFSSESRTVTPERSKETPTPWSARGWHAQRVTTPRRHSMAVIESGRR